MKKTRPFGTSVVARLSSHVLVLVFPVGALS